MTRLILLLIFDLGLLIALSSCTNSPIKVDVKPVAQIHAVNIAKAFNGE